MCKLHWNLNTMFLVPPSENPEDPAPVQVSESKMCKKTNDDITDWITYVNKNFNLHLFIFY